MDRQKFNRLTTDIVARVYEVERVSNCTYTSGEHHWEINVTFRLLQMRTWFPVLASCNLHAGGWSITVIHYYESHYEPNEGTGMYTYQRSYLSVSIILLACL